MLARHWPPHCRRGHGRQWQRGKVARRRIVVLEDTSPARYGALTCITRSGACCCQAVHANGDKWSFFFSIVDEGRMHAVTWARSSPESSPSSDPGLQSGTPQGLQQAPNLDWAPHGPISTDSAGFLAQHSVVLWGGQSRWWRWGRRRRQTLAESAHGTCNSRRHLLDGPPRWESGAGGKLLRLSVCRCSPWNPCRRSSGVGGRSTACG